MAASSHKSGRTQGVRRAKVGSVRMQRQEGIKKIWKDYTYQVNTMYLLFFKATKNDPVGQILLMSIANVETDPVKGARFPLQVHFKGKAQHGPGSPWVLDLTSNEERMDWMEAILPGSSKSLTRFSLRSNLRCSHHKPTENLYLPGPGTPTSDHVHYETIDDLQSKSVPVSGNEMKEINQRFQKSSQFAYQPPPVPNRPRPRRITLTDLQDIADDPNYSYINASELNQSIQPPASFTPQPASHTKKISARQFSQSKHGNISYPASVGSLSADSKPQFRDRSHPVAKPGLRPKQLVPTPQVQQRTEPPPTELASCYPGTPSLGLEEGRSHSSEYVVMESAPISRPVRPTPVHPAACYPAELYERKKEPEYLVPLPAPISCVRKLNTSPHSYSPSTLPRVAPKQLIPTQPRAESAFTEVDSCHHSLGLEGSSHNSEYVIMKSAPRVSPTQSHPAACYPEQFKRSNKEPEYLVPLPTVPTSCARKPNSLPYSPSTVRVSHQQEHGSQDI